jgi:di/tricarboxylate transporter
VLVLQGDDEALSRVEADRSVLLMTPFQALSRARRTAPLAGAIMVATIVGAIFNVLIAVIAGALAMVLLRCLTPRQAYRSIDARIFVFVAGAIPLGTAMKSSGASAALAHRLQQAVGGWDQLLVLLALFWIVAIITQFMSDAATTALFGPVAVALAQGLGQAPAPYVVTWRWPRWRRS